MVLMVTMHKCSFATGEYLQVNGRGEFIPFHDSINLYLF